MEPVDEYDYSVDLGAKKRSSGARSSRRRHNWEKANAPKFGPENGWELEPEEVQKPVRSERDRRNYLWNGEF